MSGDKAKGSKKPRGYVIERRVKKNKKKRTEHLWFLDDNLHIEDENDVLGKPQTRWRYSPEPPKVDDCSCDDLGSECPSCEVDV